MDRVRGSLETRLRDIMEYKQCPAPKYFPDERIVSKDESVCLYDVYEQYYKAQRSRL